MRRSWYVLAVAMCALSTMLGLGCKKPEEPAAAPAAAPAVAKAPAKAVLEDEGSAMGPAGTESAPAMQEFGMGGPGQGPMPPPEPPRELVTETGEKVDIFGPMGGAILGPVLGPATDYKITGNNQAGVVEAQGPAGPVKVTYKAGDYTAESLGFAVVAGSTRHSGFEASSVMSQEAVQGLMAMGRPPGSESQPPPQLTEEQRRFTIRGAVYVASGNANEVADAYEKALGAKYIRMPGQGLFQSLEKPERMTYIADVPGSEGQVQITHTEVITAPEPLLEFLRGMPALAQMMAAQAQQGGGPPGGMGGAPPGGMKMGKMPMGKNMAAPKSGAGG